MSIPKKMFPLRQVDDALAASLWFEPTLRELAALAAGNPRRSGPAATLLRHAVFLASPAVRPYFAVCALEAWRRVSVRQLAGWSGIPLTLLKRRLAPRNLTPAGVAAWNLTLHATWLLDVAELPARTVVDSMGLGRSASLAAVLGARGVRYCAGKVEPGAFSNTMDRYLALLRAAFRV